ncbi:MAG TPA: helix-turn-helix domain-containing protein, partial [Ktedonobacteraceae bacterium]|nr:helix-turn-helix domain-containing protein [Ktedonobacteraceae bacterium]
QELATVKEMVSQVKGSVIQSDQIEQVFAQLTSQQSGEVVDKEVDNHEVTFPPQEDEVVDSEDDKEEVVSAPADDTEDDTRSALSDDVLADVSMQSNLDQRPRITVKLQDDVVSTKRRVKSATKPSTPNDRGQARQKALRVLKRNPTLKPAELAEKAGISRQYASKIVSEQTV